MTPLYFTLIVAAAVTLGGIVAWQLERGSRAFENREPWEPDMRIPLTTTYDGKPVRRFMFTAHDGTRIIIWHENEMLADFEFERSKWRGKPKKMKELRPDEVCEGR